MMFSRKKQTVDMEKYIEDFHNGNVSFDVKEAYKTVRTNIMFATNSLKSCKKIIVTSPNPGEGKSTTSINLAISISQVGSRVLLVDSDLRNPTIHKRLKMDNSVGMSSGLSEFNKFSEIISQCKFGFDCITSGPIPPNPAELLTGEKMDELMEYVAEKYDYIIFDTPPINIVSDATILSKHMDGTILVIRNKYTTHPSIVRALKSLEFAESKVLGFLLNDKSVSEETGLYKYKYGYRYGSRYGYRYKYGYRYGYGENVKK